MATSPFTSRARAFSSRRSASARILFPEECIRAHLGVAEAHGATLRYGEPLLDWREIDGSGIEVKTPAARYHAGRLVLGVGAWLPGLVPSLPLAVERQVVCWFQSRDGDAALQPGAMPVYLWEVEEGRAFYGLPDLGHGIKAARHHGGEVAASADAARHTAGAADVEPVRDFLEHHLPTAAAELLRTSVCLYTNTPGHHFLLDRHPQSERVHVVSACSGHGFKFASAIGESVARELLEGAPPPQPRLFGIGRFPAP
jgi:sarcosine oxidase